MRVGVPREVEYRVARTDVPLPSVTALAAEGVPAAARRDPALAHGVDAVAGQVVLQEVLP